MRNDENTGVLVWNIDQRRHVRRDRSGGKRAPAARSQMKRPTDCVVSNQNLTGLVLGSITQNRINAYWWSGLVNFGDLITPELLKSYGLTPVLSSPSTAQVVSVGSVLEHLPEDYSGFILGSGLLHRNSARSFNNAVILAVRGELTRQRIGACKEVVLGDPGLLIPRIFKGTQQKNYTLGIIPHHAEKNDPRFSSLHQRYERETLIIDVQRDPVEVFHDIDKCQVIMSSSLHGLVVADALGIPNIWIYLSSKKFSGDFKFYDYISALQVSRKPTSICGDEKLSQIINQAVSPSNKIPEVTAYLDRAFLKLRDAVTLKKMPEMAPRRNTRKHEISRTTGISFSSSSQLPIVSIIIPTYNRSCCIKQTLDSIYQENYPFYEVIVVDDSLADDTRHLLAAYTNRICYVHQEKAGHSNARNQGFKLARGKLIIFLDPGDSFPAGELTEWIKLFDADPTLGAVFRGIWIIRQAVETSLNKEPYHTLPTPYLETLLIFKPRFHGAMIIRREWMERSGGFNPQLRQAEDVDLVLRLALAGCELTCLPGSHATKRVQQSKSRMNGKEVMGCSATVLNNFFSSPNLPDQVRSLEAQLRCKSLLWDIWNLFYEGSLIEVAWSIRSLLACAPSPLPIETLFSWVELFAEWTRRYAEKREQLSELWPLLRKIVPYDETRCELIKQLIRWWASRDTAEAQEFGKLSVLWPYFQSALQFEKALGIPTEKILDWWVDVWCSYCHEGHDGSVKESAIFQGLPSWQVVSLLQTTVVCSPKPVTVMQIARLWSDLLETGAVKKSHRHEVIALYLTVFGQAALAHRWWTALGAMKEAVWMTCLHPQSVCAWGRFLRNAGTYLWRPSSPSA